MMPAFSAALFDVQASIERFLHLFDLRIEDVRATAVSLAFIWLLAWAAWELVKLVARRIVILADDGDDSRLSLHEKRAQTVAQLLRSVGRVMILVLAMMLTLGQFIDIKPLLAGAGILGLAVSFGAQSLVKDVIAGTFILIENQFAVGDVIEVAGKGGSVERMTLRVVMLRDLDGTLHVIPNGQITTVSNRTRGWSRAVIDVSVGYDVDVDQALAVIRDEVKRFAQDPDFKSKLDAPPEVTGIEGFGEVAVKLRVLLRTQPGLQWDVAREFRRRIKMRLDKEGIDIPFPTRVVQVRHSGPAATGDAPPPSQSVTDIATGGA